MGDRPLAVALARFAAGLGATGLPTEVSDSVRLRVLDTLGICYAATQLPTSHAVTAWVGEQGGARQATAIGLPDRIPASQAALVNGVLAHSLDYDDTHLPSILHPSATVVPGALAMAERVGADGGAMIRAIAAGLEVCVRLGMAGYDRTAGNSVFFEHGQHATSICGAMGTAVAAGVLAGLDTDGLTNALGVTASLSSGILEANRNGGTVKRLHCGWAAHAALSAVDLVRRGLTGPPTVLEGRFGFFQAWLHGRFEPAEITDGLGVAWSIPGIFFKPYPANHFTHAALDAALELRAAGLRPDEVVSIRIGVASPTVRTVGEPIEVKRAPATGYMAQFSAPYVVAAALFGGGGLGLGLDDFADDQAMRPEVRELMQRISVHPDPDCDEVYPEQFPATLRVQTTDGRVLTRAVMVNRGGPQRPLSEAELGVKFADNASRVLDPGEVEQVRAAVSRLDELEDVGILLAPGRRQLAVHGR